ncbi:MAG: hypothetical protein HY650_13160 [Acidobacteria bacterium]|nr:hypothetical protein [Acidobacteriota bacterium]
METANIHFNPFELAHDDAYERVGLLSDSDHTRPELHGYEVSVDGAVVIPELTPRRYAGIQARLRRICIEQSSAAMDRAFRNLRMIEGPYAPIL